MPTAMRPRRSILYVPGSNARALEKSRALDVDGLILDLEDAVAPEAKSSARDAIAASLAAGGFGHREVAIRINALATEWGAADLAMAAKAGADAVLLPKVFSPGDVVAARGALSAAGAPDRLALWAMMETPLAILNARDIAATARTMRYPLTVFIMGTNDLAKETRGALVAGRAPMLAALSLTVLAARAYGIDVVDGVYNAFQDNDGFRVECAGGRDLGMDGKTLIHPAQVGPCNAVFSPAEAEIGWARRIIAAFDEPSNAGKGAISIEGRLVELLHRDMARRVVAIAEAIGGRGEA